jgi:hypothetical protein
VDVISEKGFFATGENMCREEKMMLSLSCDDKEERLTPVMMMMSKLLCDTASFEEKK